MPTGIENKLPTVTKVKPTALRALWSSFPASNNPAPVPMINRVMLIMPTSGSVRGTSRMMSSLSFLKLLHIVDRRYRIRKRQGHGIGTLKTAFPFQCSKQSASAQKSERGHCRYDAIRRVQGQRFHAYGQGLLSCAEEDDVVGVRKASLAVRFVKLGFLDEVGHGR